MEKQRVFGYVRISTTEQNIDRQIIALKEAGVSEKNIYIDRQTGKNFDRPQYKKMLRRLNENAVLYVKSIDRLGRSYKDLGEQWRIITKVKGADVVVIDMPLLDTRREKNLLGTFISDLVLALLSYTSESEVAVLKMRQAEGIAVAKARGVKFGRPSHALPDNFYESYRLWESKNISVVEAAKMCGMSKSTFYYKASRYKKSV